MTDEQNADSVRPLEGFAPPPNRCEHAVVGICATCWAELQAAPNDRSGAEQAS